MNTLCKLYGYTAAAVLALALPAAAQPVKTPQAPPGVAYSQPTPYRTHTVEIKLAASEQEGSDIEYKVAMKPGCGAISTATPCRTARP